MSKKKSEENKLGKLKTTSPTDANVSPISKALIGTSRGQKRTRSQVLKEVTTRDQQQKKMKPISENQKESSAKASTFTALMDKQRERVKKMVLVQVSPNVPRTTTPAGKKTPRYDGTPKLEKDDLEPIQFRLQNESGA